MYRVTVRNHNLKCRTHTTHSDAAIASVPPRQFDRRLVTLRSRIAKEGFIGARILAEPRRQQRLLRRVIQIGDVMHLGHLIGYGSGQFGVGVAQGAGCDARYTV